MNFFVADALRSAVFGTLAVCLIALTPGPARAQVTAFKQSVAEAAAGDVDIAAFYQARGYEPIWTGRGAEGKQRIAALLQALSTADLHGLPQGAYDAESVTARISSVRGVDAIGELEVYLSKLFLDFAGDVQTGILVPSRVDDEIVRKVPYRSRLETLVAFEQAAPGAFMRSLPPSSSEYTRLLKQKRKLEDLLASGGWGPAIPASSLKPGQSGSSVVALRNRLIAMGYLERSNAQSYDAALQAAVASFQRNHGLVSDGVAGQGTLVEINKSVGDRLGQVIVAMERERWINKPLGERHVWVNLTDFKAQIRDQGRVTYETRSVIGKAQTDRRSPEFSDVMEFMVINPSWYVPRSIATKEYLPMLKRNRNAVSHLELTDASGRRINRGSVDFTRFTARSFPFNMRQPPSSRNALGLVKFMFPNKYNIYLHDTPHKNLFGREVRAFSHGCIRLNDPFDFAYALLAKQTADPQDFFHSRLKTGSEQRVDLNDPVPVHLVYRTAVTTADGKLEFRRDVYGRDAKIWDALQREGVVLTAVQG